MKESQRISLFMYTAPLIWLLIVLITYAFGGFVAIFPAFCGLTLIGVEAVLGDVRRQASLREEKDSGQWIYDYEESTAYGTKFRRSQDNSKFQVYEFWSTPGIVAGGAGHDWINYSEKAYYAKLARLNREINECRQELEKDAAEGRLLAKS